MDWFAWETAYPLGALALLIVLGVVWIRYQRRDKRKDATTERATRELWDHPERAKHLDEVGKTRPRDET